MIALLYVRAAQLVTLLPEDTAVAFIPAPFIETDGNYPQSYEYIRMIDRFAEQGGEQGGRAYHQRPRAKYNARIRLPVTVYLDGQVSANVRGFPARRNLQLRECRGFVVVLPAAGEGNGGAGAHKKAPVDIVIAHQVEAGGQVHIKFIFPFKRGEGGGEPVGPRPHAFPFLFSQLTRWKILRAHIQVGAG